MLDLCEGRRTKEQGCKVREASEPREEDRKMKRGTIRKRDRMELLPTMMFDTSEKHAQCGRQSAKKGRR